MKKFLIPFAIGLAIGLGLTSVFVGFVAAKPSTLEESLTAAVGDSTNAEHGEVHSDSSDAATGELAAGDSTLDLAAGFLPEDVISVPDSIPTLASPGATPTSGSTTATPPNGASMETAQLAKLFASMQAREAARVLEHMDDYEVQVILNELGNREAAAILSNLSPERAAVISASVIRGERSVQ